VLIKDIVVIFVIISKVIKFMEILYEGLHMYAIVPCDFIEENFVRLMGLLSFFLAENYI
jgi:hypothetical protein